MFARPQAVQKNWDEMFFHQKVEHLVDHASNWMFTKSKYWIPALSLAVAGSVYVFSPETAVPELMGLGLAIVSPVPQPPAFGVKLGPTREEPAEDEDEEDDE